MIRSRSAEVIDPSDRINMPLIAFIVAALTALAFTTGAFDALISNHFRSWHRLTRSPQGSLPRFVEGLLPWVRVVTMLGGAAFGYTTLRRVVAEGYRRGIVRLIAVTFSPILVEMLDFGTQDGTVPDLEKLPVHSTAGLVLIAVVPATLAAHDWHQLRTRLR